jgi:hypothetical protein
MQANISWSSPECCRGFVGMPLADLKCGSRGFPAP